MRSLFVRLVLLVSSLVFVSVSFADEAEDVIKYRKGVMTSVGGHMTAVDLIVRGKASFSADLLDHAQALANILTKVEKLFPEGSDFGDTRAKDSIWSKPAEFKKVTQQAGTAASALLEAVKKGDQADYQSKFKSLGEACKACHKDFRRKKDE